MQRRVHVAGIDSHDADAFGLQFLIPDATEMMQRGLAGAVRAPVRIRLDGSVARNVHHQRSASSTRRRGERSEEGFREAERPDEIRGERPLEVLAVGVSERDERNRAERRGVIHEYVETAQGPEHLDRDRVDVLLARNVADDAVRARAFA